MNKTFCDRCGNEIKPGDKYLVERPIYYLFQDEYKSTILAKPKDLCKDCMISLKEWYGEKGNGDVRESD